MARRLMRANGYQHGDVRNLARQILDWEKGLHFPRDWADAYTKAFEIPADDLFHGADARASSLYGHQLDSEEEDVKRRTLLGILATAAATAPLGQEAEPLRTALASTITTEASDRDADAWEQVAFRYAQESGYLAPSLLLSEMLADITELNMLISRSSAPVRPRLLQTAAKMSTLTAIELLDLGDSRSAGRWWRTAARAADESGDHLIASQVRARQAVFALYDNSGASVIDLADKAIAISDGIPCAGLAGGIGAKAQALAHMGRHAEAKAAFDNLQDVFDRLPEDVRADSGTQFGWSTRQLNHTASFVHTHAGELKKAAQAQEAALSAYPAKSVLGPAQVEMHRAGSLIQDGDIDGGAQHAMGVLEGLSAEHRRCVSVRRTGLMALNMASPEDRRKPALRDAYAMLAAA